MVENISHYLTSPAEWLYNWWLAAILGLTWGFTTMIGNAAGPVMALYLLPMRLPKNAFIGTAYPGKRVPFYRNHHHHCGRGFIILGNEPPDASEIIIVPIS